MPICSTCTARAVLTCVLPPHTPEAQQSAPWLVPQWSVQPSFVGLLHGVGAAVGALVGTPVVGAAFLGAAVGAAVATTDTKRAAASATWPSELAQL